MEIPPVMPGEVGCRVCKYFNSKHICWSFVEGFGENCMRFEDDPSAMKLARKKGLEISKEKS